MDLRYEKIMPKMSHSQVGSTQIPHLGKYIFSFEFNNGGGGDCLWLGVVLQFFVCVFVFFLM